MFAGLPVDVQVYLCSLVVVTAAPLLIYWMLADSLGHFLKAIFANADVERFWKRLTIVVLVASSLGPGIAFHPDASAAQDMAVLVWSLADQVKLILDNLLWGMLGIFLPLLLAYMVLYAGRRAAATADSNVP